MKSFTKLVGITISMALIGLSAFGCGKNDPPKLKVVNENDRPITFISIGTYGTEYKDLNITKGKSEVFIINDVTYNQNCNIEIGTGSTTTGDYWPSQVECLLCMGETTTITYTADNTFQVKP